MSDVPELSVVVPVYRSEQILPKLVEALRERLEGKFRGWEVVLVNDGSPDGSWKVLEDLARREPGLVAVDLRRNRGQDNAIMVGLSVARGDVVVIMDDDLQHDPADIPRLVEKIHEGWDVCFADFREKKQAWWKNLGSAFNGRVAEIVLGKPKDVYLSPFKALSRPVVEEVLKYDGPYPYVDGILLTITSSLGRIDAVHRTRAAGASNYSMVRSIGVWMKLATGFSVLPLRLASIAGVATSLGAFLFGAVLVVRWFLVHTEVEGWTSTLVVVSFLGGIQLLSLGVVGEYVGRTYLTLNRKPQSTVRKIIHNSENDSPA